MIDNVMDLSALVDLLLAVSVIFWGARVYRKRRTKERWIFGIAIFSACWTILTFAAVLFHWFGTEAVIPELGRPAYGFLLVAQLLTLIYYYRGDC